MKDLAKLFKALSDENRLAIFQLIRDHCGTCMQLPETDVGSCISEIAEHFDLTFSTVSHHIKELKNVGLIHCEKKGKWVYCRPDNDALEHVEAFLFQKTA